MILYNDILILYIISILLVLKINYHKIFFILLNLYLFF